MLQKMPDLQHLDCRILDGDVLALPTGLQTLMLNVGESARVELLQLLAACPDLRMVRHAGYSIVKRWCHDCFKPPEGVLEGVLELYEYCTARDVLMQDRTGATVTTYDVQQQLRKDLCISGSNESCQKFKDQVVPMTEAEAGSV